MKKFLISLMAVAVVFSGCALFDNGSQERDIVSDAFKNLEGYDYYDYEMTFNGVMEADGEAVEFDVAYSGQQDNSDKAKPKFTMGIDMTLSAEEFENEKVSGQMMTDGESLYFILDTITDFNGELPTDMVGPFIGKWYRLSLQDETLGSMAPMSFNMDEENMTEEQKELKKLYDDTEFLTDVEFVKTEDGYDVYSGKLDKEASKKFVLKAVEMQGQSFTGDEEEDFEKLMDSMDTDLMMYLKKDVNALTKVTGTMTMTDFEELNGDFDFSMEFFNLGEPVTIVAPAESEEFDPMMIFAAMMGIDPATMEMMMEESAMMDESAMESEAMMMMDGSVDMEEFNKEMEDYSKEMEKAMEEMGY